MLIKMGGLILGGGLIVWASCAFMPAQDIVLADKPMYVSQTPSTLIPKTPLRRTRSNAALHFEIGPKWVRQGNGIVLEDGAEVQFSVTGYDSSGNRYPATAFGMAGDSFAASYDHLSEETRIVRIELSATSQVLCKRIYWHCFTPL